MASTNKYFWCFSFDNCQLTVTVASNSGSIMSHHLHLKISQQYQSPLLHLQLHHAHHSHQFMLRPLHRRHHLLSCPAVGSLAPIIQGPRIHYHHLHLALHWGFQRAHSHMRNCQGQRMASQTPTFLDKVVLGMCTEESYLMEKK